MGVLSCRLTDLGGNYVAGGENTKTISYLIETDSKMNDEEVLIGAIGAGPHPLPILYTYVGASCYVTSVSLNYQKPNGNYYRWVATVNCGRLPAGEDPTNGAIGGPTGAIQNPLQRKVEYWTERTTYEKIVEKERDGTTILNTAGQPFDEPIVIEDYRGVLVMARNFSQWYAAAYFNTAWRNTLNAAKIFNWVDVGQARFIGADSSQRQFENNTEYYRVEIRLEISDKSWQPEVLQRGWKHFADDLTTLVSAVDDEGQLVQEPVLLDSVGARLPNGDPGEYKTYDVYDYEIKYDQFPDLTKSLSDLTGIMTVPSP